MLRRAPVLAEAIGDLAVGDAEVTGTLNGYSLTISAGEYDGGWPALLELEKEGPRHELEVRCELDVSRNPYEMPDLFPAGSCPPTTRSRTRFRGSGRHRPGSSSGSGVPDQVRLAGRALSAVQPSLFGSIIERCKVGARESLICEVEPELTGDTAPDPKGSSLRLGPRPDPVFLQQAVFAQQV